MKSPPDLEELECRIALLQIPQIGCIHARSLLEKFGSAKDIFLAKRSLLEHTEGIGSVRAEQIKKFKDFHTAGEEIRFLQKYHIRPLFITDANYPRRLLNCYDPPILLYQKGTADLDAQRMIAIVGTRNPSDYGLSLTESLLQSLSDHHPTIVSGLAFGIDAAAHRQSLKLQLPTLGVLAHGLKHLYPGQHRSLARQIIDAGGGLLTEFRSSEKPSKHHFPSRNRIVAGLCDAVVIIESGIKGGSMVTASLAAGYHRDVFTFPGKVTDTKSTGCNWLIQQQQAQLLSGAQDLIEAMGWKKVMGQQRLLQTQLLLNLPEEERLLAEHIRDRGMVSIDELVMHHKSPASEMAALLLSLELQGIIKSLPGKRFTCN